MNLINKAERSGGKEISEALKVERNERIDKVIKELSSAINPQLASNSLIPVVDYKSAEGSLAKIIQLGGKIEAGGKITVPGINETGQSTVTCFGVDNVVREWWKGLLKDAGSAIETGIAIGGVIPWVGQGIETVYDIFTAISGYSLGGKLTPLERSLVIGAVFVPGVPGTLVKNAGKVAGEVLELHHLLSKQYAKEFARVGLNIEDYTVKIARDLHRLKPNGLHTGVENWNKQWKEFFDSTPGYTQKQVLDQLEKMKKEFNLQ